MAAVDDPSVLGTLPLLQGLAPVQLAQLNAVLHRRTVPAGTPLMLAEQPGEVAYLILSGTVKIHVEQANGMDVILGIRGRGEIVGEMSLVDRQGRSASVVTLEDCTLLWLDRPSFETCLQTMPVVSINLVRLLARRLRLATAQIQALAALDLYGRVARALLSLAEEYGEPAPGGGTLIPLRLTQSDLAGLVGASRVRVNEVMVAYKRRKYLSVDAQYRITVHNAAALARRCQ
jgi:CRP/FNR family transcriptional regulator, cyclic AMP receptor protein